MPNNFPSDTFLVSDLRNQSTGENRNTQKRRQYCLFYATVHGCCNFPQKNSEGGGDRAADSEQNDAVHDVVRFEDEGDPIAQDAKDGVPEDNNNQNSY